MAAAGATSRQERKQASRDAIVAAAARLFRERGIGGASVADVMSAAGLTHGGFYGHFDDKEALVAAALAAATNHRERWIEPRPDMDEAAWLAWIARRYLNVRHRDDPGDGCPFPPLAPDIARDGADARRVFEAELRKSAERMAAGLDDGTELDARDKAYAVLALCVGGLMLSRAVESEAVSRRLLRASRLLAARAAEAKPSARDT